MIVGGKTRKKNPQSSSIVEVSQAQLARTAAELQQAAARYDYLAQRAALAFHLGAEFK